MGRIILIIVILFFIGLFYSFFIHRYTKSKILMLLPTVIGVLLLVYIRFTINPNKSIGLESVEAIRTLIKEFIVSALMIGNITGLMFFRAIRGKYNP